MKYQMLKSVIIGVFLFGGWTANAEPVTVLMPREWSPDIDTQTISEWSEDALKGASGSIPQQGLNRYLAVLADLWDSKLMLAYVQLSGQLSTFEKGVLAKEQQAWLAKRESESRQAEEGEAGGSAAPSSYSQKYIELTKARYKDIQSRVSG